MRDFHLNNISFLLDEFTRFISVKQTLLFVDVESIFTRESSKCVRGVL